MERSHLINEIASVQKQRDDVMRRCEAEKQEELRVIAKEKALMVEQMNKKNDEIGDLNAEIEKLRRQAASKAAKDRVWFCLSDNQLKQIP